MTWTILHGDCRAVLATMEDASVDAVVTDPPYELGFMGKAWDAAGVAYSGDLWAEVLRVLKPGGHLLAFGGTRTYHRMTVAIEDAGFEVRDSIHWVYGSGFPKSLDVSKAIDKQRDDRAEVYEVTAWVRAARDAAGVTNAQIDAAFGFSGMAGHWTSAASQPSVPTLEQVPTLLDVLGVALDEVPDRVRHLLWDLNGRKGQPGENWLKREVVGTKNAVPGVAFTSEGPTVLDVTAPATPEAARWQGWGTALKPAHEPIVVARKPLAGTVATNVLEYGTGALNIDGCRIAGADAPLKWETPRGGIWQTDPTATATATTDDRGRWPANFVLTHAADCGDDCAPGCPVAALDEQSGDGASRFFTVTEWDDAPFRYVAKPSRAERNAGTDRNIHPTVKPLDLMRWLVRLVTPPGGVVLDPFAGSGTTLAAAILEGFDCVGVEMTDDYLPLIEGRCAWAEKAARFGPVTGRPRADADDTPTLFDVEDDK